MVTSRLNISLPYKGLPVFPQEATLAEIDDYIPHLPVYECGDGRISIPVDQKPLTHHFRKLGMFIFALNEQETRHAIIIAQTPTSLGYDHLPNSIGYRRAKTEPISQFMFDDEKPLLGGRVSALSAKGQLVDLTPTDMQDMGPHLQSCIVNANRFKRRWPSSLVLTK